MRVRFSVRVAVLLWSVCFGAPAQTTWAGLKFGMTEQEARSALKGRAIVDSRHDHHSSNQDIYAPFKVKDVNVSGVSGNAEVFFSSSTKRLVKVNLTMSSQGSLTENRWRVQ